MRKYWDGRGGVGAEVEGGRHNQVLDGQSALKFEGQLQDEKMSRGSEGGCQ